MLFGMFGFFARVTPPSSSDLTSAYKPYVKAASLRLAWSVRCFKQLPARRGKFELSHFVERFQASGWPVTPHPKRRCCSAVLPRAFTVWPEFFSGPPASLAVRVNGSQCALPKSAASPSVTAKKSSGWCLKQIGNRLKGELANREKKSCRTIC